MAARDPSSGQRTREQASQRQGPVDPIAGLGAGNGFVAAGRPGEAGPLRERAIALPQAREWRYRLRTGSRATSGVYAGGTLILLGEHEALCERIAALSAEFVPGDEVALMLARGFLGTADYLAGRWTQARAGIAECLRIAAEIPPAGSDREVYAYVRVLAQLAAAQGAEAEAAAQKAAAAPYAGVAWASHVGAGALALALGRTDYDEAMERYGPECSPRGRARPLPRCRGRDRGVPSRRTRGRRRAVAEQIRHPGTCERLAVGARARGTWRPSLRPRTRTSGASRRHSRWPSAHGNRPTARTEPWPTASCSGAGQAAPPGT